MDRSAPERWPEIERLLDQALDLAPEHRPAFLDRTCSTDPVLRAEVERLLQGSESTGSFLAEPASAYAASLVAWVAGRQELASGTPFGAYEVVRQLGRGGMATVYLAQDHKHHRAVAIKVLHPELAAAVGPERFLREIEIAAGLHHPHILPLYDSGVTDGLLYYAMPYIEGESLRQRLTREEQLRIEDALRIVQEVAGALDYAHRQGVVHRDIKPENILLQDGQAIVADFGIARAIDAAGGDRLAVTDSLGSTRSRDAVGRPRLTEPGPGIGTPAYMSPEQASSDAVIDGRTDIYALGCVLYEMLAGQPPFTGSSRQEILARHAVDPVPSLHTVPPTLERAVVCALAKLPADRFATAAQFAEALLAPERARKLAFRRPVVLTGAAALAVVFGVWAVGRLGRARPATVDPAVVAIAPFRVSGADSMLSEGMVDLLAPKFSGEGGPRAASPRSVISAWRRAVLTEGQPLSQESSLSLSIQLGAGKLLLGSIVGTPDTLFLSATLLGVPDGRELARAEVQGPPESLASLVNQLASQVHVLGAGASSSMHSLMSTSLPALRAYLAGQAAYRRGRWEEAVNDLDRAVSLDSTFALAALALAETSSWYQNWDNGRGVRLAWMFRDRLSAPERDRLTAQVGPRYPADATQAEMLAARQRLVAEAPDSPDAWYLLGDQLYHWGVFLGIADSRSRAAAAFRHALELDSTPYFEPLSHLTRMSAVDGDTVLVRRYCTLAMSADSLKKAADCLRWHLGFFLGDSAALAQERASMDGMSNHELESITNMVLWDGLAPEDGRRALELLDARAVDDHMRLDVVAVIQRWMAYNAGRPAVGREADERFESYPRPRTTKLLLLLDGLYWDGDAAAAAGAARDLAPHADAPLAQDPSQRDNQYREICSLEQWRLWHGESGSTARAIRQLRRVAADSMGLNRTCAVLLEAWFATVERRPGAGAVLDRLDSLLKAGSPTVTYTPLQGANLVVARLREAQGDQAGALAAVRRRGGPYDVRVQLYQSSYLREEGRLAALAGDTAGAIRAYSAFLALRHGPEPALKPEVNRVRAELARLVKEHRRN